MENGVRLPLATRRLTDNLAFRLGALTSIGLALLSLWLFRDDADAASRVVASDVLSPLVGLLAAVSLVLAAWRSARYSRRVALAWGVLALAHGLWFVADVIWAWLELGLRQPPFPSAADYFYLSYYPVFLLGVLLLPAGGQTPLERAKMLLDIATVMLAAILVFGLVWIGPLASAGGATPEAQMVSVAYPAGDLVLVFILLMLLFRPVRQQSPLPLWPVILGVLAGIAADLVYGYQTLAGTYQAGAWVDAGWIVQLALVFLGAVLQATTGPADSQASPRRAPAWLTPVRLALPYASVVGAYLVHIFYQPGLAEASPLSFTAMSLGVGGLIGLVIVRQLVALAENLRLSRSLQAELAERRRAEADLQQANEQLRREAVERQRAEKALRQSEARLRHEAFHDLLTGLPNRTLFIDRLGRSIERARRNADHRFAVLFLDCDGFKVVNDSLGHHLGDQLLVAIAQRLTESLRKADTVARLGGDEFAILLEDLAGEADAVAAVSRVQAALAEPFELDGRKVFATVSIGVVPSGAGYERADDVLRDADIAMYQAKLQGKARYAVFTPGMHRHALARLNLESELHQALRRQEFRLVYQPIFDLRLRRTVGFEALLRWRHPQRGFIPPSEFIPAAEETGLIIPIDRWALREACRQMSEWHARFSPEVAGSISVNLSARQFRQADLVDQVRQALHAAGLANRWLKLEITESAIIEDMAAVTATLDGLRALGVQVQIDDFGTGYSSLSYLYHFPLDALKIDRAFVSRIDGQGRHTQIVRAVITLAHELGLSVVAEGVETPEQIRAIQSMGCEQAQGYLVSRPLEAARAAEFLAGPDARRLPGAAPSPSAGREAVTAD